MSVGCGVVPTSSDLSSSLEVFQRTGLALEGTYESAAAHIVYSASQPEANVWRVHLSLNDKAFITELVEVEDDFYRLRLVGDNVYFSEEEKHELKVLQERLEIGEADHEEILRTTIDYLNALPEAFTHSYKEIEVDLREPQVSQTALSNGSRARKRKKKSDKKSIECIKRGNTYFGKFNDKKGETYNIERKISTSGSLIGACGVEYVRTGWTQDCLNHDLCEVTLRRMDIFEIVGGLGPNCLDEFMKAVDDFILSRFIGCKG